ncbi:MAG: carboxypeptidase-like regulatory domain-containing protein, partial [Bacteroidota bacterium]
NRFLNKVFHRLEKYYCFAKQIKNLPTLKIYIIIKKLKFIVAFVCLISINSYAQKVFKVELKDSQTSEPISYATVRLDSTNKGVIADYNGQFRLPVRLKDSVSFLNISSIGYANLQIDVDSLKEELLNTFTMDVQLEVMDAVVIDPKKRGLAKGVNLMTALQIVKEAVKSIPKNISSKPHSYLGYYRDYQISKEGEYLNLNEALIEEFDAGIFSHKVLSEKNQAVLYEYRNNTKFKKDSILALDYNNPSKFLDHAEGLERSSNELLFLNMHNPIRIPSTRSFSFVHQLNTDFIENHIFKKNGVVYLDGEPIITISFYLRGNEGSSANYNSKKNRFKQVHDAKGEIQISLYDFAIHAFDYSLIDKKNQNPLMHVTIEYRRLNDKMFLNYITFNNEFVIEDRDEMFRETNVDFNQSDSLLVIDFSHEVDVKTIKTNRFKLFFKGRRIPFESVTVNDTLKSQLFLKLPKTELELPYMKKKEEGFLKLEIKRLKDVRGKKLYEKILTKGFQFREFFVQEVFENKFLDKDLEFINKIEPLSKAKVNDVIDIENYIINSPLMFRKM